MQLILQSCHKHYTQVGYSLEGTHLQVFFCEKSRCRSHFFVSWSCSIARF